MLLLLIEDEKHIRAGIAEMLADEGYQVLQAEHLQQAIELINDEGPDAVLSDINLPDGDGLSLLAYCKAQQMDIPIIYMTAFGSRELAVEAIKQGAYDYIAKPLRFDELFARLHRLKEMQQLKGQVHRKKIRKLEEGELSLLGDSVAMQRVRRVAAKAMVSNAPMIITGETGVGKGLLAKMIHSCGERCNLPFVSINCASIPENLLESELFGYRKGAFTGADRNKKGLLEEAEGTLFLDEIGEMPLSLQAKLLHVLDNRLFRPLGSTKDHRFIGRIIAATNVPTEEMLENNRFRNDLYYRLAVVTIEIPPLRQRIEDIVPLAERIYYELQREMGHAPQSLPLAIASELPQQLWPGNVRQLRNYLERALIFDDGPAVPMDSITPSLTEVVQRFEQDWIRRTIAECNGDKTKAAQQLQIGTSTLYRKLDS